MKYIRVFITLLFMGIAGMFITSPTRYMQSFFNGITVWAYNVLPALFPFAVLSTLALKFRSKVRFSLTQKLFGINCDGVWIMSLLCGYPIGAKAIANSDADVYAATKMFSFCATASPIFMLATVGAKLLRSPVATLIIFISHIFSAVINGLIYRTNNVTKISENKQLFRAGDFGNIITDSALSVISVGGLVALFYMLADMLKSMLPISLSDNLAIAFLIGLLEMTNGIFSVCNIADITTATVLVSALLSFGGMCVLLQCYSYLGQKNVKVADVLKSKFTQCILATLISLCLVKILM